MNASSGLNARDAAIALLEWYRESGIDTLLLDTPRDRFAETRAETEARARRTPSPAESPAPTGRERTSAPPPPRAERAPEPIAGAHVTVPDEIAVADARERARSAETLDQLEEALRSFGGCNLRITARTTVFGDGPPDADLMLIGEAPGREEDAAGVPFVGRSGQLLDRMLASIGIERQGVRVTNTVPWRPPGNRPPTPTETELCLPFLQRHIELVRPKILVCLGAPSAKAILGAEEGILRLRGRWMTYAYGLGADEAIPTLAMLHPAYLLRQPAQKRLAWRDLVSLSQRLTSL